MSTKLQEARAKHAAALADADAELAVAQQEHQVEFHGLDLHSRQEAKQAELAAEGAMAAAVAAGPAANKALQRAYRELRRASIPDRNAAVRLVKAARKEVVQLKLSWWAAWHRANVARYRFRILPSR